MVIGKISSLATTIIVFALAFIFLKQAYGTSIGKAGVDVGTGLTSTAGGISSLISAFINPITSIFGTLSGFFGGLGPNDSEGGRNEPSIAGRDERKTPDNRVRSGDTSTITWSTGTTATVPSLSAEAKSYYSDLGVKVT
jgi:hypothetical protein